MNELPDTICIVEDNASIRNLFGIILKKKGYSLVMFEEGQPAIAWLKENMPVATICDDMLPDINGTEIIKIAREFPEGKRQCIISVTGYAMADDRERYVAMGFDGYIPKPVNTSTFADEIREIIESKRKDNKN